MLTPQGEQTVDDTYTRSLGIDRRPVDLPPRWCEFEARDTQQIKTTIQDPIDDMMAPALPHPNNVLILFLFLIPIEAVIDAKIPLVFSTH